MIKTVFFDLGDVIVKVYAKRIYKKLFGSNYYGKIDFYKFAQKIPQVRDFEKGLISPEQFYLSIKSKINKNITYSEFKDSWNDIFEPISGTIKILEKISDKYKTAILSNTNILHINYLKQNYDFFDLFNYQLYSFELGSIKPDKKIFQKAVQIAGSKPEESLFIDDNKENIISAKNVGFNTVLFNSTDNLTDVVEILNLN